MSHAALMFVGNKLLQKLLLIILN